MSDEELHLEKDASNESFFHKFETETYVEELEWWFKNPRMATLAWVYFCVIYWGVLVLLPCVLQNDLSHINFGLWVTGMIGVCGVYYCVKAGHPADSPAGKPVMAFTCLLMAVDWISGAYRQLNGDAEFGDYYEPILMFCHSLAMLWASLFFYNRAVRAGERLAWLTLLIEWIDLIFMCIVILIIQNQNETCLNHLICWGYFLILSIHLLVWFFPIMLGFSDTEKHIHIHMVILDLCTDAPLVVVIILSKGYNEHWFLFIDISLKLILVLRSIAYHGIYSLILKHAIDKDDDGIADKNKRLNQVEQTDADDGTNQVR